MKKILTLLFLVCSFVSVQLSAQSLTKKQEATVNKLFAKKGEIYFRFIVKSREEINTITRFISIDNVKGDTVYAFANKNEFKKFLLLKYRYKILPNPNQLRKVRMKEISSLQEMRSMLSWNTYPTYSSYETIMSQFVTTYPQLCRLYTIGTLSSGRKLLVLKISDNVNIKEGEPQFLYSSSMHGDETAGYVDMLNFIDYLLSNYGTNSRITNLVNNMEIWINPLANPDGTYAGGNNTVNGATRYNANNIDLNRNYPDPAAGQHPDGNAWQPETQAFMGFADTMNFVMSANFHGGSEVVNYPWDTWSAVTADNNWWVRESKRYADTVHANSAAGYFTSVTSSGYTNGYAWYRITGGRQDYMNYFKHCRECTIELSNTKILPASSLTNNYNYNYRSMLNYMEEATRGIRGVIKDSCTGQPLKAKVFISGHDFDSSHVYSALPIGNYHRPIYQGTYNVTFSAPGYQSKTVNGITVSDGNATIVNVSLLPTTLPVASAAISSTTTTTCSGDTIVFNSNVTNGGPTPFFQWQVNGVNAGTDSSVFITSSLNTHDTVQCIVTSSATCITGSNATSNIIVVTVYPLPAAPVVTQSGDSLFSNAAYGNQWYNSATGIITGATGTSFIPSASGNYYAVVTDSNGCTSLMSNVVEFILTSVQQANQAHVVVYPNPVTSCLSIQLTCNASLQLTNLLGQHVWQKSAERGLTKVDCRQFGNGVYFLVTDDGKTIHSEKIIVAVK